MQSDTDEVRSGGGTGGSRSLQLGGSAVWNAAEAVLTKARALAAHLLESSPDDIVVHDGGGLGVAGVPARAISWAELAPEIRHASFSTPLGAAPATSPAGLGTAFGQMALAGMGGSALAGAMNQRRSDSGKAIAATASAGAGKPSSDSAEQTAVAAAHTPLTSVAELAAGIRELGELHDAGYLTGEEFAAQKRRLLSR